LNISSLVNIPIRKNCEEDDVGTNSARVNTYVRMSRGTENERKNKPTLKRWRLVYISRPRNREKENELLAIVCRSFTVSTLARYLPDPHRFPSTPIRSAATIFHNRYAFSRIEVTYTVVDLLRSITDRIT